MLGLMASYVGSNYLELANAKYLRCSIYLGSIYASRYHSLVNGSKGAMWNAGSIDRKLLIAAMSFTLLSGCGEKGTSSSDSDETSFLVTGPDGKEWNVNAPAGTTKDEAIQYIAETRYGASRSPAMRGTSGNEDVGSRAVRRSEHSQRIGNFTYHSDGTSSQRIGNFTYHSDGTSSQRIGNFTYHSDGTSSQRIGNFTYHSDGTSSQQIGNFTYNSDGTSCQKIGNSVYCN